MLCSTETLAALPGQQDHGSIVCQIVDRLQEPDPRQVRQAIIDQRQIERRLFHSLNGRRPCVGFGDFDPIAKLQAQEAADPVDVCLAVIHDQDVLSRGHPRDIVTWQLNG